MLTGEDEKKIKKIIKGELKRELTPIREDIAGLRGSVIRIEQDRKILKDIWEFVKDHTHRLNNHEERITNLESSQKIS